MAEYISDIIDDILTDLRQDTASPVHFSRAEVLRKLNDCQLSLCRNEIFLAPSQQAIALADGVRTYDIDEDAFSVAWAVYDNEPLDIVTKDILDAYKNDWLDDEGEPYYILVDFERPKSVTVYKKTDATYNGEFIYLQNFKAALTDLVDSDASATGILPSPVQYERELFMDFAKWKLFLRRSEYQDVTAAGIHMNNFRARLQELKTKAPKRVVVAGSITVPTRSRRGPKLPDDYPQLTAGHI